MIVWKVIYISIVLPISLSSFVIVLLDLIPVFSLLSSGSTLSPVFIHTIENDALGIIGAGFGFSGIAAVLAMGEKD